MKSPGFRFTDNSVDLKAAVLHPDGYLEDALPMLEAKVTDHAGR